MAQPFFSVIIPSYNHSLYIEEAVISIFDQSFRDFELIVVDDGSTDSTLVLLEKLKIDHNFTLVSKPNGGPASAVNQGIRLARGEWIVTCSSDDFYRKDRLDEIYNYVVSNNNIVYCHTDSEIIDENGIVLSESAYSRVKYEPAQGRCFKDIAYGNSRIVAASQVVKRAVFHEIGYYDENLKFEDYDMQLRISSKYDVGFIPQPNIVSRSLPNSLGKNIAFWSLDVYKVIVKLRQELADEFLTLLINRSVRFMLISLHSGNIHLSALHFYRAYKIHGNVRVFLVKYILETFRQIRDFK